MRINYLKNFLRALLIVSVSFSFSLKAAAPPDAGQVLQEIPEELKLPSESAPIDIEDKDQIDPIKSGGIKTTIKSIVFKGNTAFTKDDLMKELGDDVLSIDKTSSPSSFIKSSFVKAVLPLNTIDFIVVLIPPDLIGSI